MSKLLRSSKGTLVLAVILASLGSLILYGYLHNLDTRVAKAGKLVDLLVARTPIEAGSVVRPEMLQTQRFPDKYLLSSMLTDPEQAVGKVAICNIAPGDPLLTTSLSTSGQGGRAALMLPRGMRAYPLGLEENHVSVSELQPGDRVDAIFVPEEGSARTLLHSLTLLCISPYGDEVPSGISFNPVENSISRGFVLLSVTPDEAEILAEAEAKGEIVLSICPLADDI